jgi:hypothetical protein
MRQVGGDARPGGGFLGDGDGAGTQSTMTPMSSRWQRSTKRAKPSGEPKRAVGANRPSGW